MEQKKTTSMFIRGVVKNLGVEGDAPHLKLHPPPLLFFKALLFYGSGIRLNLPKIPNK